MKKIRSLPESSFLRVFFAYVSLAFVVAAFILPDRADAFTGLWRLMTYPCKISTNYFALGGYSATFLNMGLVVLFCLALTYLPGCKPNNVTTLAFLLTVGFASWGMNIVNMIPTILGVCLYALVKKEKLGSLSNAMMFSTGIAPLISDLLFRYPNETIVGFNWLGLGFGWSDHRLFPACRPCPQPCLPQRLRPLFCCPAHRPDRLLPAHPALQCAAGLEDRRYG